MDGPRVCDAYLRGFVDAHVALLPDAAREQGPPGRPPRDVAQPQLRRLPSCPADRLLGRAPHRSRPAEAARAPATGRGGGCPRGCGRSPGEHARVILSQAAWVVARVPREAELAAARGEARSELRISVGAAVGA
eukprot:15473617-Alexandrium_andersonii.AAC.4